MIFRLLVLALLSAWLLLAVPARASTFQGELVSSDSVALYSITVAETRLVQAYVTFADFDSLIALWTSSGSLIALNDDAYGAFDANQDDRDAGIQRQLAAGSYYISVTAYPNFPLGDTLSDGFGPALGATGRFTLNLFDVEAGDLNADVASPVPVPGAVWLLGPGLAAFVGLRRRI